jgi:hypothetical protein
MHILKQHSNKEAEIKRRKINVSNISSHEDAAYYAAA